MNESKISTRYAKALFSFTLEKNIFDKINADVQIMQDALAEVNELSRFMFSPIVKSSQKISLLSELLKDKVSKEFLSFLKLIVSNKRESFLSIILRNYKQLYKTHIGIKTIILTTIKELSANSKNKLLAVVEKEFQSKIELIEEIDPTIIGGFKLRVDDVLFDASISNKLKKVKNQLIEASVI